MATLASAASRGPLAALLSNNAAQWVVIGAGAYLVAPEHLRDQVHRGLLAATASASEQQHQMQRYQGHHHQQQPLILRMDDRGVARSGPSSESWGYAVVKIAVVVGGVWVSYYVVTQVLPHEIAQFMPATTRALDDARKKLADSIFNIKETLVGDMKKLLSRQDTLEKHQKETVRGVKDLQDDVLGLGEDVQNVHSSVSRCELSLEQSKAMQAYTGRGVKLLVTAVSSMMNPDDQIAQELHTYLRAGEMVYKKDSNSNNRRAVGPENDRPRLSRSNSSSVNEGQQDELTEIKQGRWSGRRTVITPAM